jgi:hypothetical protein
MQDALRLREEQGLGARIPNCRPLLLLAEPIALVE